MTPFTLPLALLATVAPFMAKGDRRPQLDGVLIEANAHGIRATATDGHILGTCRDNRHSCEAGFKGIIPRDTVLQAIKLFPKGALLECTQTIPLAIKIEHDELTTYSGLLDITYPDWRPLFANPSRTVDAIAFDPALLARIDKAATAAKQHKINTPRQTPHVAIAVNDRHNAMPWRLLGLTDGITCAGAIMPNEGQPLIDSEASA